MMQISGFSEMFSSRTFIPRGMLAIAASDLLPLLEHRTLKAFTNHCICLSLDIVLVFGLDV